MHHRNAIVKEFDAEQFFFLYRATTKSSQLIISSKNHRHFFVWLDWAMKRGTQQCPKAPISNRTFKPALEPAASINYDCHQPSPPPTLGCSPAPLH